MDVVIAISGRQSVRAFDGTKAVSRNLILRLLQVAGRAPSGSNIQPWQVYVVSGKTQRRISEVCVGLYLDGNEGQAEYSYYPIHWREPYLARRRATGFGLYGLLGIDKTDTQAVQKYRVTNYQFFGAPIGLFFTIDRDMELGRWLDYGMFLQSLMLCATQHGLETCPQAAFCPYHEPIMRTLGAPTQQMLVCGMSMGYPLEDALINTYRTDRLDARNFSRFLD